MSWMRKSSHVVAEPALVRAKAISLLARREHSRRELQQKLQQHAYPSAMLEECLDALEQQGLLNEPRYAHSYAASRAAHGYGPLRISAELRQRGIAPNCIEDALATLAADWCACLQHLHRKRLGTENQLRWRSKGDAGIVASFVVHGSCLGEFEFYLLRMLPQSTLWSCN